MIEQLDYIHGALEEAEAAVFDTTGRYGRDEARAWIWAALVELEALKWESRGCGIDSPVTDEQREAARWPTVTVAKGAPTLDFCDWCGQRFKPTSFDRVTCCCRPQTVQQCEAMSFDQCRTCYEVNERDCIGYEDRMDEAQRDMEWATEEAAREPREAK